MAYKVSVVVPVYNAEKYIERAVESVIHLPATGEVLLVDDASKDNSKEVCIKLANKYENVFFFEHPDGKNHGASGARNLGIKNARFDYVSFLDADDYYLPNRFDVEAAIFTSRPDVDGVYGCTLAEYESPKAKEMFQKGIIPERMTVTEDLPPEQLFKALMLGGKGRFHTSGISVRKTIFEKTGIFNPRIRYIEDTELWFKFSLLGKLVPGSIQQPVAIRWVHESNSIHENDNIAPFRKLMYKELFAWAVQRNFPFDVKNSFFNAMHRYTNEYKDSQLKVLFREALNMPSILFSSFFLKKLHLVMRSSGNKING